VNREYLISTVRSYRDKLLTTNHKPEADDADDLLQELLDAGRAWHTLVPTIHSFVDRSERLIRRAFDGYYD
jgi:hypothetical protein